MTITDALAETTDGGLAAVGIAGGKLELITVRTGGKLERDPIVFDGAAGGVPVPIGVAVDRRGRAVVALRDGRLAVRDGTTWTTVTVGDALPAAHPGPAPAVAP